jgi:hypothetical protein
MTGFLAVAEFTSRHELVPLHRKLISASIRGQNLRNAATTRSLHQGFISPTKIIQVSETTPSRDARSSTSQTQL